MRLISPSIEPWMTRETESKSALRWTNLDNAERIERERAETEIEEKRKEKRRRQGQGESYIQRYMNTYGQKNGSQRKGQSVRQKQL